MLELVSRFASPHPVGTVASWLVSVGLGIAIGVGVIYILFGRS